MALLSEDLYGGVSVDLGLQSAAIKRHNATNSIVQHYYHTSLQYQNDLSLNQVPALERLQHNSMKCQNRSAKILALPLKRAHQYVSSNTPPQWAKVACSSA